MPTLTAATDPDSGWALAATNPLARACSMASARATYAPVMAAVRVPPSAWSTSQSSTIVFSPNAFVSITARRLRPTSRLISWVRAADPALDGLAVAAGVRGPRQHRVLRGHPALAAALAPARDAGRERGGAQHAGLAELDQHAALGVVQPASGDRDRAELVGGAAVDARGGVLGLGSHAVQARRRHRRRTGHPASRPRAGRPRPRGPAPGRPAGRSTGAGG